MPTSQQTYIHNKFTFIPPEDVITEVLSFVVIIFQQTAADVHEIAYSLLSVTGALILYKPDGIQGSHTLLNTVTLGSCLISEQFLQ